MIESQLSICAWHDQTFGPARDIRRILARANEKASKLLTAFTMPVIDTAKIIEECADITIILCPAARLADDDITDVMGISYTIASSSCFDKAIRAVDILLLAMQVANISSNRSVAREIGSVVIKLAEICAAFDGNLADAVDAKMAINRASKDDVNEREYLHIRTKDGVQEIER